MISDRETNFVYISGLLEKQSPIVFKQLKEWFDKIQTKYGVLPDTKDIWVVDFMPLQVEHNNFLQYDYDPDYLKAKKYDSIKTDSTKICRKIGINYNRVNITLDGGNVVKSKTKAILTTKVFKENPDYLEQDLISEIKNLLMVEQIIIIPQEPKDFVGHADGMVRFVNENTVLVNQYPKNKIYQDFGYNLRWSLKNAGLQYIELPYSSWQNANENDATGCYINFLEVDNYIFAPIFGQNYDHFVLEQLKEVFNDRKIIEIDCRDLAIHGGVLNCVTWNILK